MSAQSRWFGWLAIAVLAVVLGVLAGFSFDKISYEVDMTEDSRFTLPEPARELARSLEDTFKVTVYLSNPLPSYLNHVRDVLRKRLDEFREASKGRLEYEFIDPAGNAALEAELKERNIVPVAAQDVIEGKVTTGQYYLWATFQYQDQSETYNLAELGQALRSAEMLQSVVPYQIAARISKALHPDRKIGILADKKPVPQPLQQGFGQQPTAGVEGLAKGIESHYPKPIDVTIKSGLEVRDDITTLIVHRPDALTGREIYELDQFLLRGGKVVVLLDTISAYDMDRHQPVLQGFQSNDLPVRTLNLDAVGEDPSLREWLAHFGVQVGTGVVEDRSNVIIRRQSLQPDPRTMQARVVQVEQVYPGFVVATAQKDGKPSGQFSEASSVFSTLTSATFLWPAPLTLDAAAASRHPALATEVVVRTSDEAWVRQPEADRLKIQDVEPAPRETWRSFPLVVATRGRYRSFWADKAKPPRRGPDGQEQPEPGTAKGQLNESSAPGQLWVLADSDFVSDFWRVVMQRSFPEVVQGTLRTTAGLVNALDAMTLGDALIEIRRPNLRDRSVPESVDLDQEKPKILWRALGLPAAIIVGLGLVVAVWRFLVTGAASPRSQRKPVLVALDPAYAAKTGTEG